MWYHYTPAGGSCERGQDVDRDLDDQNERSKSRSFIGSSAKLNSENSEDIDPLKLSKLAVSDLISLSYLKLEYSDSLLLSIAVGRGIDGSDSFRPLDSL